MISEFELFRDKGVMINPDENSTVPRPGGILSKSNVIGADIAMKNTFVPQIPVA